MKTGSLSSTIRPIALGVLFLLCALIAFWVLRPSGNEDIHEPALVEPLSLDEGSWIDIQTTPHPQGIDIQGRLRAEQRLELFPEAQARVISSDRPFREGVMVRKGEPILQLDDREARLELYALRSAFNRFLTSLLPDIKLDYPDKLSAIESWIERMDPEQQLPGIPEFEPGQFRQFLTARGVYDQYYQIRSAETRLEKFAIRAPFTGVITSARVEPGQSVGPQTHMGSFIDPNSYRLTVMVRPEEIRLLDIGTTVELYDESVKGSWTGTISRISPVVESRTQSVEVQLQVRGEGLREGAYLQGRVHTGRSEPLAVIPVTALRRDGSVYRVEDGEIERCPVDVVYLERESVQVRGLSDGDRILRSAQTVLDGRQIMEATP